MMQRLTHSTIVQRKTRIRRERLLPYEGEVIVRIGQEVTAVQAVARARQESRYHILPGSELLQVPPEELSQYLLVEKGAIVEQGTPLLRKKRFLGSKQVVSPVDGTFYDVNNGRLVLQETPEWIELRAMVQSRVVNYISNRGVVLEIFGSLIQAAWGSGKEGYGKLKLLTQMGDTLFTPEQVSQDISNSILVVGKVGDLETLQRAEAAGVGGLIAGSMPAEVCAQATLCAFPIILTDGIGTQGMSHPVLQLLQQLDGFEATLFGKPVDRWGNRPEIVIPQSGAVGSEQFPIARPLAVGQMVRILRAPHSGKVGKIIKLYNHSKTTPIGTRVYGADVKLLDETVVFAPYANLDSII